MAILGPEGLAEEIQQVNKRIRNEVIANDNKWIFNGTLILITTTTVRAGLGGVGGPYRLDAGHDVHQVSDEVKNQVPEHIRKAAREMNRKAYAERLREIKMSEHDAAMYEQFSSQVPTYYTLVFIKL